MSASELDTLVTGAEIGRRLGISTQRVHQLAAQQTFPAALGWVGNSKVWRWAEIAAWDQKRREPASGA